MRFKMIDTNLIYLFLIPQLRNRFHYPAARLALEHGKHVLVEKPFACTVTEAEELFRLARERGVFIMEALWSNFTPAYERLRELLRR